MNIDGVLYIEDFIVDADRAFDYLKLSVNWDERMTVRKTASYGTAYNYSQISYPDQPMPPLLDQLCTEVCKRIGFRPNNCLINYYPDGSSKMGFHSDQTDILNHNTGVIIISLGATRTLRFRNIGDKTDVRDFDLLSGSLFYMSQDVQHHWEHAIPKSDTRKARISLTLRSIK
ncbi:alpha-ketoglutarate-dependent dioxygenase AlkB family protein [Mucilaginibacter sp. AW1-3]